jgi:hypothetical protein
MMSSRERRRAPSRADIEAMIDEATVDAYDDGEVAAGWEAVLQDHLGLPFTARVLGVEVTVETLELHERCVVAICARGRNRQAIPLLDLPLPKPPPVGWEWIAAYRTFSRGTRS